MLRLVDRYLLAEVAKVFFAIISTLLLIVISMLLLRTLEEVNVGALNLDLVFQYMGLQMLRDASSLLPPAFFLSILATLSRLSRDSELIALNACGIGPNRLYRALLIFAIPLSLLTGWFSLSLHPWASLKTHEMRLQQQEQTAQIAGLQPGRFYVESAGNMVVYIGSIGDDKELGHVFILDRRGGTVRLVVSNGGRHRLDSASGDHIITLLDGYRFDGNPGDGAFLVARFSEYEIRVRASDDTTRKVSKRSSTPTSELDFREDLGDRAELESRIGAPLAIFTLVLMSIPLINISPRQRTSGRLFLAFLAYFCFFNLERLSEGWLENGVTPPWLTSLWYQPLILAVVYLALLPDSLWTKRMVRFLRSTFGPHHHA